MWWACVSIGCFCWIIFLTLNSFCISFCLSLSLTLFSSAFFFLFFFFLISVSSGSVRFTRAQHSTHTYALFRHMNSMNLFFFCYSFIHSMQLLSLLITKTHWSEVHKFFQSFDSGQSGHADPWWPIENFVGHGKTDSGEAALWR